MQTTPLLQHYTIYECLNTRNSWKKIENIFRYQGVGMTCIRFPKGKAPPPGNGSVFSDAVSACQQTGDMVLSPSDLIQNAILKAALSLWVINLSQFWKFFGHPSYPM